MNLAACGMGPGEPLYVTAMINEPIMPVERGEKYGQPLDAYLAALDAGEVVGGGTALGPSGGPDWVELEIELTKGTDVLPGLAAKLKELGAPDGSYLYYFEGDQERQIPIE